MIDYLRWKALPLESKTALAAGLGIKKSGPTLVENGYFNGQMGSIVRADGYVDSDLAAVTVEKLQEFTQSTETDIDKLWTIAIDLITNNEQPIVPEGTTESTDTGTTDRAGEGESESGEGDRGEEPQTSPIETPVGESGKPGRK